MRRFAASACSLLAFPLLLVAVAAPTRAAPAAREARFDFGRAPSSQGFVLEGEDDGRFQSVPGRRLDVALDASAPAARLVAPLPFTLDGDTSFRVEVDLVLADLEASPEDFFQAAFALVRRGVTGMNRTGRALPAPPWFVDDADTFDMVEWGYYPNVTAFGGPTLQPSVFGAESGPSAFWNFAANFGPSADLGDNGPGQVTALPLGVPLRVTLDHDACARTLNTRVHVVGRGGALDELDTGIEPIDLGVLHATGTFTVDALALPAWQDLADPDPSTVSLTGLVTYLSARVQARGPLSARLLPQAVNPGARGPARIAITGASPDAVVRVVAAGGAAVDVPLDVVAAGEALHALVPRPLAAEGGLVIEVDGCALDVAGPRRVVGRP